ncbi:MAG: hypothetical protein FWC41_13780 [Firmicutes bacterium]|nr:hypothetical protein [Bacillota bacterium]
MKFFKLKILLVFLMLFNVQFSCTDKCDSLELHREPYFSMQNMAFKYVDLYWVNLKSKKLMWEIVDQNYEKNIYPCDSLAMYFEAPDTSLIFHSKNNLRNGFNFTTDVFACIVKQNGYAGTRDLVDKIFISSNYDFDETHNKNDNLSDIVEIFAYTTSGQNSWKTLDEYNKNSPYEAPKRFYLLIKRKPTRSKKQQFVVKYYMKNEIGEDSKYFIITTPVFNVR